MFNNYYLLHILFIHLFAMLGLIIIGDDWQRMVMGGKNWTIDNSNSYGYPLWAVYIIWIGIVVLLHPISKKYMIYKANNRDKWWLSYL